MHGHFGFDVSETMNAIRAMFAKHRPASGVGCAPLPPERDYVRTYLTIEQIVKAKKLLDEGYRPATVAAETGMSATCASNIGRKKRRFADLPDDNEQIPAWFARKQSKYHPHQLR